MLASDQVLASNDTCLPEQILLQLDEALDLSALQEQAQAVASSKLAGPAFIHQSLWQSARGQKLAANTVLYGMFTLLTGPALMLYGTSLLNVELVCFFLSRLGASYLFVH